MILGRCLELNWGNAGTLPHVAITKSRHPLLLRGCFMEIGFSTALTVPYYPTLSRLRFNTLSTLVREN